MEGIARKGCSVLHPLCPIPAPSPLSGRRVRPGGLGPPVLSNPGLACLDSSQLQRTAIVGAVETAEVYVRAAVGAVVDGAGVLAVDRVVEAVLVQHNLAVQCLAGGDLLAQLHGVQYARACLVRFEAEDLRYGAAAVVGADGEHVGAVFLLCSELLADAEGAVV